MKTYTLIGPEGRAYESSTPGTLGGHRGNRVYGRLDCPGALRWIARGHYVRQRVFFANEADAVAAGYRPCGGCMQSEYRAWKDRQAKMRRLVVTSPVGRLALRDDGEALVGLAFARRDAPLGGDHDGVVGEAAVQLSEYFAGTRDAFDLPLRFERGSEFERRVWDALLEIPYGATTTYGELAAALGEPGAARAVGAANGRNPIAIVVPCHRVVGAGGKLTGYGGGLPRKRALLALEGAAAADAGRSPQLSF